jgi:hypothetical protein
LSPNSLSKFDFSSNPFRSCSSIASKRNDYTNDDDDDCGDADEDDYFNNDDAMMIIRVLIYITIVMII